MPPLPTAEQRERQPNERGMIRRRDLIQRLIRSTTLTLLLSPAGLLLISAVRLVIVADYNPATALAILTSGGYVNTLLGTIMPLVPIIMPYLALVLLFLQRAILGVLALAAAVLISPISAKGAALAATVKKSLHTTGNAHSSGYNAVLIPMLILFFALLIIELADDNIRGFLRTVGVAASFLLVPTIWIFYPLSVHDSDSIYSDILRPWLPAERITLANHRNEVVFTLSNDGNWSEVLTANGRQVRYYPASEITARVLCQIGQAPRTRPLIPLVQTQTNVPPCTAPAKKEATAWLPPVVSVRPHGGSGQIPARYLFPQYASHSRGS